jgi:hypothetical protein
MPARSKVAMLPNDVRNELERRIIERSFGGYQDLADWLQAQGYRIAHDSVQRYGARLARKIEASERLTHQAQAFAAAINQADATVVDVTIQLIHQRILALLLEEPGTGDESISAGAPEPESDSACAPTLALPDLARMTRILADLNRVAIARQRQQDAGDPRPRQPAHTARAARAETRNQGLSEEAYHAIRNALLGIDPFDPKQREQPDSVRIPPLEPEPREPERAAASNKLEADASRQAEKSSCTAAAPSLPEPSTDAVGGPQTLLDADSRSSTPKAGSVLRAQDDSVPFAVGRPFAGES